MKKRPLLAITPGDPEGIGPEVTWKSLRALARKKGPALFCIGARKPFERLKAPITELGEGDLEDRAKLAAMITQSRSPRVFLLPAPTETRNSSLPGFQSGWSIARATELALSGIVDAVVTGPISKERLNAGGYPFPGHTEFLAHLSAETGSAPPPVTMMLANDELRVSLVTIHVALKDVASRVTADGIRLATLQTVEFLRSRFGIKKPKIAVAALNPHAGESGLFGDEDRRIVAPAIEGLSGGGGFVISGPHPADTLFAKHRLASKRDRYDAVICMYHDQGLVPVKLLDFKKTVNITLGLPFIRTSVDHGVGFDIAGKGRADPSSMLSAIELASRLRK